jgi:hypothetical protein
MAESTFLEEVRRLKAQNNLTFEEAAPPLVENTFAGPDAAEVLTAPIPDAKATPKASKPRKLKFTEAFSEARAAGAPEFEWEGKAYTTEIAEDKPAPAAQESVMRQPATTPADSPFRISQGQGQPGLVQPPVEFRDRQQIARDNTPLVVKQVPGGVDFAGSTNDYLAAQKAAVAESDKQAELRAWEDRTREAKKEQERVDNAKRNLGMGEFAAEPPKEDYTYLKTAERPLPVLTEKSKQEDVGNWLGIRAAQWRVKNPNTTPESAGKLALDELKQKHQRSWSNAFGDAATAFTKTAVDTVGGTIGLAASGTEGAKAFGSGVAKVMDWFDFYSEDGDVVQRTYKNIFGDVDPAKMAKTLEDAKESLVGQRLLKMQKGADALSGVLEPSLGTKVTRAGVSSADGALESFVATLNNFPDVAGQGAASIAPVAFMQKAIMTKAFGEAIAVQKQMMPNLQALVRYHSKEAAEAARKAMADAVQAKINEGMKKAVVAGMVVEAGSSAPLQMDGGLAQIKGALSNSIGGRNTPEYKTFFEQIATREDRAVMAGDDAAAKNQVIAKVDDAFAAYYAARAAGTSAAGTFVGSVATGGVGERAMAKVFSPAGDLSLLGKPVSVLQTGTFEATQEVAQTPGEYDAAKQIATVTNGEAPSLANMMGASVASGMAVGGGSAAARGVVTSAPAAVAGAVDTVSPLLATVTRAIQSVGGAVADQGNVNEVVGRLAPDVREKVLNLAQRREAALAEGQGAVAESLQGEVNRLVTPLMTDGLPPAAVQPSVLPGGLDPTKAAPIDVAATSQLDQMLAQSVAPVSRTQALEDTLRQAANNPVPQDNAGLVQDLAAAEAQAPQQPTGNTLSEGAPLEQDTAAPAAEAVPSTPAFITGELRMLAARNGVLVTPNDTPVSVLQKLAVALEQQQASVDATPDLNQPTTGEQVAAEPTELPTQEGQTQGPEAAPETVTPQVQSSVRRNQDAVDRAVGALGFNPVVVDGPMALPVEADIPVRKDGKHSLSQEQALVMGAVMRSMGVELVLFSGDANSDDGFVFKNDPGKRVFLKVDDLTVPPEYVIGHEMFHNVEAGANGSIVQRVYDTITGDVGDEGIRRFQGRAQYQADEAVSELTADVAGETYAPLFTTIPFWRQVTHGVAAEVGTAKAKKAITQFNRALGKKIARVKNVLNNADTNQTGYGTSRLLSKAGVTAAQNAIIAATRDFYGRGVAGDIAAQQAGVDLGVQFSTKKPTSDIGHKRRGTDGSYVGAPDWVTSGAQLTVLRKKLRRLAMDGVSGRFWYEKSSKAVLDLVGGDKVEAEKFVGLLAIYSQGTEVSVNTGFALEAYYQWKAGMPIHTGRFPVAQSKKAEAWLNRGEDWGGIKVNNFYADLMEEIDPGKVADGHATMDMWMALAFDYGMKVLDQGPKYNFAKRETTRLAEELGWKPHQVQAAIWTAIKSRVEGSEAARNADEIKQGIAVKNGGQHAIVKGREYDHFRTAHKFGMDMAITPDEIAEKGLDFADSLAGRMAQMSWEATPSVTGGDIPGIHTAPTAQKFEYLLAVANALTENGKDLIAEAVGLHTPPTIFGFSAWEGAIGAGAQSFLPVPIVGQAANRAVLPVAREMLGRYSALKGLVMRQDAVVWHVPIWSEAKDRMNGVELVTRRALDEAEMRALYDALNAEFGTWELAPGYTTTGARVLNFVEGLGNKAFLKGVNKIIDSLPGNFGGGFVEHTGFRSDGDYISNNWKENPNGEEYLSRLRAGRPDIQERAASLRARVEAVNDDFIKRYGWGGVKRSLPRSDAAGSGRDRSVPAGEGRPSYGTATEGAVSAVGVHYSNQERSSLSGTYYGTGLDGAERARVMASNDTRLRERIYFYASTGTGVFPETGVGGYPHSVNLNNLYDAENDPLRLAADKNGFESAILDAGFDGYIAPFGNNQKAAVLLGRHTVPVQQEAVGYRGQDTAPATTAKPNDTLVLQRAIQANRSLPAGQMTGADWKRLMPKLMPEVDVSHLDDNKTYYKDGLIKRDTPEVQRSRRNTI